MGYHSITAEDPREVKLPAWARDMIDNARRRVKEAEKSAQEARLATGPDESDMLVDRYDQTPIGLGKRPTVRVVLGRKPDGEVIRWIDIRLTESRKSIEVMGSTTLRVTPQVTNVIAVTAMEGNERGEI